MGRKNRNIHKFLHVFEEEDKTKNEELDEKDKEQNFSEKTDILIQSRRKMIEYIQDHNIPIGDYLHISTIIEFVEYLNN